MLKAGRPLKPVTGNARVGIGTKVTASLKRRLDAESAQTGRTQSQIIELRLEQSVLLDDLILAGLMKRLR